MNLTDGCTRVCNHAHAHPDCTTRQGQSDRRQETSDMPNDRPPIISVCIPIDPDGDELPSVANSALREAETIASAISTDRHATWSVLRQLNDDDLTAIQQRGLDENSSWLVLTAQVI